MVKRSLVRRLELRWCHHWSHMILQMLILRREGGEILGGVGEGRVMEEDLNCLYRLVFYLLDLTLNNRQGNIELVGAKSFGSLPRVERENFNSKSMADVKYLNDYVDL